MHFSTFLLSTFTPPRSSSLLINHHSIIATSPSIILLTFVWTCEFYPTTCPHFLENMMIQWSTHVKPKINIPAFLGKSKRPSGNNTYGQLAFSLFFGESTPQPWESIGCLMVFWGKPRESIGFFWVPKPFTPCPSAITCSCESPLRSATMDAEPPAWRSKWWDQKPWWIWQIALEKWMFIHHKLWHHRFETIIRSIRFRISHPISRGNAPNFSSLCEGTAWRFYPQYLLVDGRTETWSRIEQCS